MRRLSPPVCCVSVDVDAISHYHAIHGLKLPEGPVAGLAHGLAIRRLCDWAHALDIPLTWFVVARDTDNSEFVRLLTAAVERGHEIASHSLDHRYDLVKLAHQQQREQVDDAQGLLEARLGQRPLGFRAPGYTVTDQLLDILEQCGLHYDSSVFPCPPYYAAKALVRFMQRLQGRHSRSILDHPRVLVAPTQPYRSGRPYVRRGSGIIEIPIQVTPGFRLPFIGTTLTLAGPHWARRFAKSLLGVDLVNLELHALDLLSVEDGLDELAAYQRDVRVPLVGKFASLSAAVDVFRVAGYQFATLADAARRLTTC